MKEQPMDRGNLGERVRAVRKARDLSQEALAREAGVSLNLVNKLERGVVTDPHYSTLSGIARALGVPVQELVREPALVGKGKASRGAGPTEAERQRPSLDQVREVFAPLADGLNSYCARWEEKLPSLRGASEEVEDFFLTLQEFRAIILRVLDDELYAIAEALDLGSRYGGQSGLPRDMRLGFIRGEVEQHSLMHQALKRYFAVGHALAKSIGDGDLAESMRQAQAEVV
jgi:transcriptional regulator with XRE-family HTH domain